MLFCKLRYNSGIFQIVGMAVETTVVHPTLQCRLTCTDVTWHLVEFCQ